jgi:hypothetical protein
MTEVPHKGSKSNATFDMNNGLITTSDSGLWSVQRRIGDLTDAHSDDDGASPSLFNPCTFSFSALANDN